METGIKQNEDFWRDQWAAATAPEHQSPWLTFAGVVFEGIYRGKDTGLKEACRWMAQATPWDEQVMCATLDQMLPAILAKEESTADVQKILGDYLMLLLRDAARRKAVRETCKKHGLAVWTEVLVPVIHRPVLPLLLQGLDGSVQGAVSVGRHRGSLVICSPTSADTLRALLGCYDRATSYWLDPFVKKPIKEQWEIVHEAMWSVRELQILRPKLEDAKEMRRSYNRHLAEAGKLNREFSIADHSNRAA